MEFLKNIASLLFMNALRIMGMNRKKAVYEVMFGISWNWISQ